MILRLLALLVSALALGQDKVKLCRPVGSFGFRQVLGVFLFKAFGCSIASFCAGSTAHFQKLHSDMRPAQPLKGQGKGYFQDAPIHSKEHPPCVAVNYIIQARVPFLDLVDLSPLVVCKAEAVKPRGQVLTLQELTPWNGAMRIVPWRSMQQYCQARNRVELPAPGLEEEYRHCRDWLQSKIFPLQAGDCLIRSSSECKPFLTIN